MRHLLVSVVVAVLLATPALAAPAYRAEPAAAPVQNQIVIRETVWTREGAAFRGTESMSRPGTVCSRLVKKVGPLKRFEVSGTPISDQDLQKCNGAAPAAL